MKRIVLALCITAAASLAIAQEPHMKMRMMGPDPGEIAATLGLSTDQKVQWDSIHQQLQASVEPLHQQLRAAHEAAHSKLTAILTPDQKAKFDSLHHEMGHGAMEMHMRHPEPGSRE